jgi:hypothetical protein
VSFWLPARMGKRCVAFLVEWISVADRRRLVRNVADWFGVRSVLSCRRPRDGVLANRMLAGFLQAHAELRTERPPGEGPSNTVKELAFSVCSSAGTSLPSCT